jgi:hypothetical protein
LIAIYSKNTGTELQTTEMQEHAGEMEKPPRTALNYEIKRYKNLKT